MALMESVKERFEKITGWARPSARDLDAALRPRKANAFQFKDDGVFPNNPKLPLVFYRSPVRLAGKFDPAAVFEELFERNGWDDFGGMAFTNTRIATSGFMKCSALRAGTPESGLAARRDAH
jgi:hypothetical protein